MRTRYKILDNNNVYFITSTIVEWLPVFTNQSYFDLIIDSLNYCTDSKALHVYSYVILENHLHLIASAPKLSDTIASFKKYTARNIIKKLEMDNKDWLLNQFKFFKKKYKTQSKHQVWQEGVHPQLISNGDMFNQKIEYIHYNPVKRGYVDLPEHWRYSSARNYLQDDHSVMRVDMSLIQF